MHGILSQLPKENWVEKGSKTYSSLEVVSEKGVAVPVIKDYLNGLFTHHFQAPQGYQIVRAYSINNHALQHTFESKRDIIERRLAAEPVFRAKKYDMEDVKRMKVLQEFTATSNKFSCNEERLCKAFPVIHGLNDPNAAWKICQGGMATLSSVDAGWYGAGESCVYGR